MKEKSGNPKISVVIPMYNCEKFIPELFQMFDNQSFTDFEVVCVIDGATDGTERIVRDYCKNKPNFRYVVQENKGAGIARNTGLDLARGKYTVFCDADDDYYPDYLEKLYKTAVENDAQIVICRFVMRNYKTNTEKICGFNEKIFHENTLYSHASIDKLFQAFVATVTNKMFDTSFLKTNKIYAPSTKVANDAGFFYAALCLADRIFVVHDVLLCFRVYINDDCISSKRGRYQHETIEYLRGLYLWLKEHSLLDMHLEDYLKKVNGSIVYAGKFEINPRYISECAHMLNAEEPWSTMTTKKILVYLWEALLAENALHLRKKLLSKHSLQELEADGELKNLLNTYNNRILIAEQLRQVSKEQYGRDFNCKSNKLRRLMRSIRRRFH